MAESPKDKVSIYSFEVVKKDTKLPKPLVII
jgi:hypothetical protein